MLVYHGSVVEIQVPRIIKSERGRDFGFAFYTTDLEQQAKRWAFRKAMLSERIEQKPSEAIVNVYEYLPSENLKLKEFHEANEEWLDLVVRCRSDPSYSHGYDIVIGKIANDNVGETVDYVLKGIMRKEDAVQRLKFSQINNQIAFCSERSLHALHFLKRIRLERKGI